MDTQTITPSDLNLLLEAARDTGSEEREEILRGVLDSGFSWVIRRIPKVLSPLSEREKDIIVQWARGVAAQENILSRDFAFHLMVNCGVPMEDILTLLEAYRTSSKSVLNHIQGSVVASFDQKRFDCHLAWVAETMIGDEDLRSRDFGRHMLMNLASTPEDWQNLAKRFSEEQSFDLRQAVIERFLRGCSDESARETFANNVIRTCFDSIDAAEVNAVHREAPHMHWILICYRALGRDDLVEPAFQSFVEKFGFFSLPYSIRCQIGADSERTIEGALASGWKIVKDDGRQVVLQRCGESITRYRPRKEKKSN